jgi:mRNA-decapping enzyme subunit 1
MAKKKIEQNGKLNNGNTTNNGNITDISITPGGYNYTVISSHDKYLAQIITSSPICNVYKFNIETSEWDKLNCQGSAFIYSRAAKELDSGDTTKYPYAVIVLNRLNMDDFSLGITPLSVARKTEDLEMEVKYEDPFIMVQGSDGAMYGLWLFNETDRETFRVTIDWCLNQLL